MPRPSTIDYLNARRAALTTGGGDYTHLRAANYARTWQRRKLAPKPQKPCDHGLFSDEALQLDLVEMLMEPDYD